MQRHFASNDEILGVTTTIDINGAIRALNEGASWEEAKRLCPVGGPVVHCNADGTVQVIDDDSHSVTFASTGRGKTRRFIYPTLYADICSGTNIVVNDMKGEIYATCRGLLDLAGYTTYVLDLRDTSKSPHRYNPLGIAWDEWHQGKHDSAFVYLRNFALSMFDALATNTTDAFWPNSAVDYFMGLSLGLLEAGCSRDEFTIESVARMDRMGNEKSSGFAVAMTPSSRRSSSASTRTASPSKTQAAPSMRQTTPRRPSFRSFARPWRSMPDSATSWTRWPEATLTPRSSRTSAGPSLSYPPTRRMPLARWSWASSTSSCRP